VEQVVVVLVPAEAVAGPEHPLDVRRVLDDGGRQLERAREVGGALLLGERQGLLGREAEALGRGVVGDVSAGGHRRQPLADVPLGRVRAVGELGGGDRLAVRHRPEQAEALAERDQREADRGAEVGDEATHQGVERALIDHRLGSAGGGHARTVPRGRDGAVNPASNR
jgi:hypothetical protein